MTIPKEEVRTNKEERDIEAYARMHDIIEKMGGARAMRMIGATRVGDITYDSKKMGNATIRFQGCEKYDCVTIQVNGDDLFDMTFYSSKTQESHSVNGLYHDMLMDAFEEETGLFLTIGTRS